MSQENTKVVRQAFTAWNRGDIERYIAHLCFDVEAVPMGAALEGKVWRGHDEIRAWRDPLRAWSATVTYRILSVQSALRHGESPQIRARGIRIPRFAPYDDYQRGREHSRREDPDDQELP